MSDKKKRNGGETALWRRWLLPFLCVTGSVGLYLALTVAGPSEGPVSGDGRVAREGYGGGEQEYQLSLIHISDWGSSTSGIKKLYANPAEFMRTWEPEETRIGWIKTPRGWWYRYADGAYPANKWLTINHHWYLFNPDGYMCTGWHRWNGSVCDPADGSGDWYYFDNTVDGPLEGACWHTHENGAQEIWYVE